MRWLTLLIFLYPFSSHAAVTINEVAWMGNNVSANHEWIELYNDGNAAVSVSDWNLNDGMNLDITLTGSIPAKGYAVLERTSDEAAPGAAFLIYTGALVNTGATLRLLRADGGLEDQVAGGEGWENIGGDNVTKETAQYTSSGWITTVATPGKVNSTSGSTKTDANTNNDIATETSGTSSGVSASSQSETVRLVLPDVTLQLEINAQKVGYLNQEIDFDVEPGGIGDTLMDSLIYDWNFGDGYTETGKSTSHHYEFPGTYVVTVYGNYKRQSQVMRHEITILPVTLSLTRNKSGDLQINNDSPYEIDVSGYRVQANKEFIFADRSVMLPNQTVTLKGSSVGGNAKVYDSMGTEVVSEGSTNVVTTPAKTKLVAAVAATQTTQPNSASFGFSSKNPVVEVISEDRPEPEIIRIGTTSNTVSETDTVPESKWPYVGLATLLAVATGGVMYRPKSD